MVFSDSSSGNGLEASLQKPQTTIWQRRAENEDPRNAAVGSISWICSYEDWGRLLNNQWIWFLQDMAVWFKYSIGLEYEQYHQSRIKGPGFPVSEIINHFLSQLTPRSSRLSNLVAREHIQIHFPFPLECQFLPKIYHAYLSPPRLDLKNHAGRASTTGARRPAQRRTCDLPTHTFYSPLPAPVYSRKQYRWRSFEKQENTPPERSAEISELQSFILRRRLRAIFGTNWSIPQKFSMMMRVNDNSLRPRGKNERTLRWRYSEPSIDVGGKELHKPHNIATYSSAAKSP